jgi:hypothetical protein
MLANGHWYTSPSVIGWTSLAVLGIIGIAAIVAALLGLPHRKLVYSAEITSPIATSGVGQTRSSRWSTREGRSVIRT